MLRGFAPSKHLSLTFRENRFKASALSRCEKAQCEPAWQRAGGAALGCMRFTRAFGKSKPLLTCLSSSPAHFSVELMQYMGSTSVFLRSYDNLSNSHVCEAEIKSIVDESETALLDDMDFKFEVQIDLAILRNIVKTASALNSSDIRLQVFEPKKDASSRLTAFRVSAEGGDDATPASTFVSQLEGDCNVIRTEDSVQVDVDLGDMDTSYDEKFSVSYLHSFMKSMERQSLSLKISPTETNSPRMPLVIEYPLGKTDNFIKFVLAPRLD